MVRAVFLDRDGVLNANLERSGRQIAPTSLAEFRILPGVAEAVERLRHEGFVIVVVTNQPDVAMGRTTRTAIEAMHAKLRVAVPIDDLKVCFHVDADQCSCRKPKPGMLYEAAQSWNIDLDTSYLVGDRWRDIEAGRTAGCVTILVDYGCEQDWRHKPDKVVGSLSEAVTYILDRERSRRRL